MGTSNNLHLILSAKAHPFFNYLVVFLEILMDVLLTLTPNFSHSLSI